MIEISKHTSKNSITVFFPPSKFQISENVKRDGSKLSTHYAIAKRRKPTNGERKGKGDSSYFSPEWIKEGGKLDDREKKASLVVSLSLLFPSVLSSLLSSLQTLDPNHFQVSNERQTIYFPSLPLSFSFSLLKILGLQRKKWPSVEAFSLPVSLSPPFVRDDLLRTRNNLRSSLRRPE